MSARSDGLPRKRQPMPGGNGDLQLHEIEPSDLLRYRMLHLQARVDLQEIKIEVRVHQKLDCASVEDRKSTRLNSSHLVISYAVFCLKKKKKLIYKNTVNMKRLNHGD